MTAVTGRLEFNIGNQEIVNYLVEQQVQALNKELATLIDERLVLLKEKEAICDTYKAKRAEAFEAFKVKVLEVASMHSAKCAGMVRNHLKLLNGNHHMTGVLYTVGPTGPLTTHYVESVAHAVDGPTGKYTTLSLTDDDEKALKKLNKAIRKLDKKAVAISNKLARRGEIERTMLAQMTRAVLDGNPDLVARLQSAAAGAITNQTLLTLPAQ